MVPMDLYDFVAREPLLELDVDPETMMIPSRFVRTQEVSLLNLVTVLGKADSGTGAEKRIVGRKYRAHPVDDYRLMIFENTS